MSVRQILLIVLSAVTTFVVGLALVGSWQQPQIQSRLDLAQINLSLQAAMWEPPADWEVEGLSDGLLGEDVYETAIAQYRETLEAVRENLDKNQAQLKLQQLEELSPTNLSQVQQLEGTIEKQVAFEETLEVRLGILLADRDRTSDALKLWSQVIDRDDNQSERLSPQAATALVLTGLWRQPPQTFPQAEVRLNSELSGWFRYRALSRLYRLGDRQAELTALNQQEQQVARESLLKLLGLSLMSGLGLLLGTGLLLFLIGQRLVKGETAILAQNRDRTWAMEWRWDTILQVVVLGFFIVFFLGQLVTGGVILPLVYRGLGLDPSNLSSRWQAVSILVGYLISASAALTVLYASLKPYFPLKQDWFRFDFGRGVKWGFGGYLAAVPLVLGISLINQQIWQGKGGSNPILEIALEGRDWVAIACFFITASVLAPVFEELMFRGFLLPSLTRYVPTWGAIVLSASVFALAHLSASEVLPLATLGIVLGLTYTRSRNLLAAMLMHGLWNSGTLLSLVLLGGGAT